MLRCSLRITAEDALIGGAGSQNEKRFVNLAWWSAGRRVKMGRRGSTRLCNIRTASIASSTLAREDRNAVERAARRARRRVR
jgi:hypothetical protein